MLNNGQIITLQQGQYKILGSLGSGGQGSIWTVESLSDGEHYALKTVNRYNPHEPELEEALSPKIMTLLIRYAQLEIDLLSHLNDAATHHILPCLDHGTLEKDGYQLPTFVMPLYKQGELTRRISQIHHDKGDGEITLTFRLFLKWFQQLMVAVNYLHQSVEHQRLIHRDISPRNCLLSDNDDLYLIDFGLTRESSKLTFSFAHAEDYCAPEQYFAQAIEDDERSRYYLSPAIDLYSAALVMHKLLTNADTHAQLASDIERDRLKNRHSSFLHRQNNAANKPYKGKIGMLGKVGGLTSDETRSVNDKLLALLRPKRKTMAFDTSGLPDNAAIANDLVQLMQHMLAPWPDDRPSAKSVLQTLAQIDAALSPQLSHLRLIVQQPTITVGTQAVLTLEIKGTGLPEHFDWVQLIINEVPVTATDVRFKRMADSVTITLASFEAIGHYRIRLSALVNDTVIQDEVVIEAKPTAEQLWYSGQREAALTLELNKAWLNEWEAGAKTTRDKYQLSLALERLQQHYPTNTALAERFKRVEGIVDDEPIPVPTPFSLRTVLAVMLLGGVGGGYYLFNQDKPVADEIEKPAAVASRPVENPIVVAPVNTPPAPEEKAQAIVKPTPPPPLALNALKKDLSTGNQATQQKAWQRLQQLIIDQAQHPDIKTAKKLQKSYEDNTIKWIQAKNKKQQKTAFIRLQVLADKDNKAQHWLGIAYWRGLGTTVDYKQAWLALRTTVKQGNDRAKKSLKSLEADITVKLQANDKKERLAVYPALEAMAEAGEPNAQWVLATLYLHGKDRPQDMKKGKIWTEKAAQQGIKPAIETLKNNDW